MLPRRYRDETYPEATPVNPFNIFNAEPLVVSKSPGWAVSLTFLSMFWTLSLGLVVVGIRRPFKLE
jgi:hypothetical protein